MGSGKVILGVLAGVAVGATLGILFAPDKGSATRKKLSEKGEGYAKDLEGKFNDLMDSFKEKFEEASEDMADHVKKQGEEVKSKMGGQNPNTTRPSTT